MSEVFINSKTKERIFPIYGITGNHTMCLFLHKKPTKKGQMGYCQPVRTDKIVKIKDEGY